MSKARCGFQTELRKLGSRVVGLRKLDSGDLTAFRRDGIKGWDNAMAGN